MTRHTPGPEISAAIQQGGPQLSANSLHVLPRPRPLALLPAALLAGALALGTSTPATAATAATAALPAPPLPVPIDLTPGSGWTAGGDVESINPTQAMIDSHAFYLGGYGLGSGTTAVPGAPSYDQGRFAAGILGKGPAVRAVAFGDGGHSFVTAQIETQGYFLAYKAGDYGIVDIRREAAARIAALRAADPSAGPDLPARSILVDSDHSHGGPDTAGVWGGVPTAYLQEVKERSVAAIVAAWRSMQPVDLRYGVAQAGVEGSPYDSRYPAGFDRLMTNQFSTDPDNQVVDDEVRVIRATSLATGQPVVTYVNFSAHPTVLGADNRLATGDYVGPLSDLLAAGGGMGLAQVATLGREQPARGNCGAAVNDGPQAGAPQLACLDGYARRVDARVQQALATAQPVSGQKVVAMSSYFLTDAATNAVIVGLDYGGFAAGAPLLRAITPPWMAGGLLGTTMFSGRLGDLVFTGNPGEPYPQMLATIRADAPGKQGYFSIGTAGDFLGYIVYPFTAYPEPIRRSILSGDPPPAGDPNCQGSGTGTPAGCPAPVGNDNFFFNLSQDFGQRLVCAGLRGVTADFPDVGDAAAREPACAAYTADAAVPAGYETQFSSTSLTPDAPTVPTAMAESPYAGLLVLVALPPLVWALRRRSRSGAAR